MYCINTNQLQQFVKKSTVAMPQAQAAEQHAR
jgi:hypothetical protein